MRIKSIDGLPIIDSKRPIKIIVTPADCRNGDSKEPESCAFAKACRREMHVEEARVHLGRVYLKTKGGKNWTRYITPKDLRSEIIAFDRGGQFASGQYTLASVPPKKQIRGRQGSVKVGKRKVATKKRKPAHVVQDVRTGPA